MNESNGLDWLVILVILAILIVLSIFLPRLLIINAIKRVIKTFIKKEALNPQNARTAEELGIKLQSTMWDNMLKIRDYRPQALQILLETEIIIATNDNRFYLVRDKLESSRFKDLMKMTP